MKKILFCLMIACVFSGSAVAETKKQAYTRLVKEGEAYVLNKQYAQSIEKYNEAIALIPGQALARLELAEVYKASELFPLALQEYQEVLRENPKSYDAYFGLGTLYLRSGMNTRAMDYFKAAMTIKGGPELYRQVAACAKNMGEIDLAVAMLKNVVSSGHNYDDLVNLGSLYQEQKLSKEAEDMFSQAIKQDKDRNEAYFYIGMLYLQDRDLTKAENIFQIVLERVPGDALVHFFLSNIYYQQKNLTAAKREIKKAKELSKSPMLSLYSSKFEAFLLK
jgi:tetratricopeptide (TPR) repeat protein